MQDPFELIRFNLALIRSAFNSAMHRLEDLEKENKKLKEELAKK